MKYPIQKVRMTTSASTSTWVIYKNKFRREEKVMSLFKLTELFHFNLNFLLDSNFLKISRMQITKTIMMDAWNKN